MVEIKDISGKVLFSVLPNEQSKSVEELMNSDYIQLSWMSDKGTPIPLSAYIECNGEKYTLHEPYTPIRQDECTYQYAPQFQSRIMNWSKQITPIYTYEEDGRTVKSRDMDWDFTGSPADAMYIIKQAIKNETGEDWTVQLSDSLPATITISSQSSSIFSILNSIASECKTEWWADKKTNTLYLSKCIFGESITLEVGNNVQVPSVASDNEGYYTRFYAFGSTRNIVQGPTQSGAVVNNRLTLDPVKYPNGYKDIREGLKQNEIFVKVLYFDEIYPSSKLTISDVRARLRYRLDNAGQKIQIGGTEEEPVYEQYAIWYFQIADFSFNADMIIEGKKLSVSFGSGQLASRDFELAYHEKTETVSDANDVTPFEVKAGDYEIIIDETSGQIIPGVAYIIPQNGDSVILYNIQMPAEYTASAQTELEKELDKAMAYYTEDNNSYQIQSDPTWFYTNKTDISMGQAVTFINGTKSLSTRVLMVEKRLDLPCYQTIKVGNKVIKGNTQQLKDEVASANQNIDVIQAFNELSASLSQAYANAQREMIEGFAAIKNLWTLETDENGEKYAYTKYNVLTQGGVTQYSAGNSKVPSVFDGLPLDNTTIRKNPETGLIEVIGGTGTSFDENAMWSALSGSSDNQINKSHLTNALAGYATESWVTGKGYATESWVASKNYATTEALNAVSNKLNDFLEGSDTDTIINKWKELETFLSGMAETDNLAEILETKADKKYVDSTFVTLATKQTITGEKTFSSVMNTAAIKASGAITAPSLAVSDWVTIAGIKLRKLEDGALMLEGNLALTGGLTTYASDGVSFASIYDGLPIDNDTIYWQEVEGSKVLKAKEGSGSSFDKSAMWAALEGATTEQINKTHLTTALNGYATESWVTSKNYLTSVSIATISDLHANWDALLKAAPSAYVTRWPTISEVTDRKNLIIKLNGGSTEGTNLFTYNVTGEKTINITPAGIGAAASSHNHSWSNITSGKPSTLSGYGITDAYTKTESDSKYPTKTGSGASGTWGISITGNAGSSTKLQTARTLWGRSFDGTANVSGNLDGVGNINASSFNSYLARNGNDQSKGIPWYGVGIMQNENFFNNKGGAFVSGFFGVYLRASEVELTLDYATKSIIASQKITVPEIYINGIRLYKSADGVITLEGNLAVTGGVTMYAIDPVSVSTVMDGVAVDGTTIAKVDGVLKVLNAGGGEAGSVAWGNITGKPSVFATNIANITDLHSSWDAVLAAQKPAWLTAVSIATISDLHANWDALLKAAPSAYVTRWPTISEVTNKQNLVIKLNGGTTEGTNQFTYNATGAKTINITPAGIGAAASSHNHSWSNITSGKPTTLSGYGITDAYTKTDADNRYVNVAGDTMTGNLSVKFSGRTDQINLFHSTTTNKGGISLTDTDKVVHAFHLTTTNLIWKDRTVWDSGNDGSGSGLDADLLDGTHKSGLLTALTSSSGTNISITVGGTTKSIADLYANSAYKLENTHTIWGQNFNGTQNITGRFTSNERVYADKGIWVTNNDIAGWGQSNAALNLSIPNTSNTSGIICVYRSGQSNIGSTRFFSMEISNSSDSVRTYYANEVRIDITPTYMDINKQLNINGNTIIGSGGNLGIGTANPAAKLHVIGNILATGGGTYYSSDIRYKSIMQQVKLSLSDIAKAPSFVYHWNKKGMKCDRLNLGGSAQYTQKILPWAVNDNDNFLSMDYATVAYTFAVHTARHLLTYETRTDKKIKKLEREIVILKKQLKKIGYEEVRTLDDSGI